MSDFHEVTADNLKAVRTEKTQTQDDIAALLGITQTAVSKIESGTRGLSDSEKKLLDWHFFGILPEHIHGSVIDLARMLEFTEAEWLIISHIARRQGITAAQWIVRRIRDYLAILDEGSPSTDTLSKSAALPAASLQPLEAPLKVAETPHPSSLSIHAPTAPTKYPVRKGRKKNGTE